MKLPFDAEVAQKILNVMYYQGFGTELDTWLKKSCRKIWSIVHVPQILHTSFSILLWSADNGAKTSMESHFNLQIDFVCSQLKRGQYQVSTKVVEGLGTM